MNKQQQEVYDRLIGRLRIDRSNLREEIVEQPQQYFEAGRLAVQLTHAHETAREQQKGVTGAVTLQLQEDSETKLTVKALDALVEQNTDHLKARRNYKKAGEAAGLANVLRDAWISRGYLLKDLAALEVNEVAFEKERSDKSLSKKYKKKNRK